MGYIYKITNKINSKCYIGKTARTINERWKEHQRNVTKYPNLPLYRAFIKYGLINFEISKVEQCDNSILDEREIYWIKTYDSYHNGYNCTLGGEGGLGDYSGHIEEIISRYKNGERLDLLCKEFSYNYTSIRRLMTEAGIEINTYAGPQKLSKKIYKVDPYSKKLISVYPSISAAARDICPKGHNYKSIINHICKQKNTGHISHGFEWYTEEEFNNLLK